MKKYLQVAALVATAFLAAAQQRPVSRLIHSGDEWVEEITGSLPAAQTVKVRVYAGPIHIEGARQRAITYTIRKYVRAESERLARRELRRMKVAAATTGGSALISADSESDSFGGMEVNVHVPIKTSLVRLETSGGPIVATNIAGKVEAHTGGDKIRLDQIGSSVLATTGGGDIEIGKIDGEIRVETGGGNIRIGAGEAMNLQTGAGSIHVDKCNGEIMALTGGGAIALNEVTGQVKVETAGGPIRLGPMRGGVRAETGSGPIVVDLAARRGAFTASRLETLAGDIVVYIPDDLGVNIQAAVEMANGRQVIISDFPGLRITRGAPQWGPRAARAEGALNGGGPLLQVHTTTGVISIRRKHRNR